MNPTIYHNPRCSKSRQTLQLLQDQGCKPVIVQYLDTPVDELTLTTLLQKLGLSAKELMRSGETEYKAASNAIESMSEPERIQWLVAHPKVLQRPIVVNHDQARIGRPPEAVLEIFD